MRSRFLLLAGALVVAFLRLRRWVLPLDSFVATGGSVDQDCFQGVWNLWFACEAILDGRSPWRADAIFHPLGADLAHHTLSPGYVPFVLLVRGLVQVDALYPLFAYKLLPVAGFALMLAATYGLGRAVAPGFWPAATAAVAYTFSRFHMHHVIHPNYVGDFCVPLCILLLVRLDRRPSARNALAVAAGLGLGFYFTEVMLYVGLAVLVVALLRAASRAGRRRLAACVGGIGPRGVAAALLLLLVIIAPYARVLLHDRVIVPEPAESVQYSANLLGLFVPEPRTTPLYEIGPWTRWSGRVTAGLDGSEVFLGFVPVVMALVALVLGPRRRLDVLALLAGLFLLLALGPSLGVLDLATPLPLPEALLRDLPIFAWSRTPVRYLSLASLFLALLAARGVHRVQQRTRPRLGRASAAGVGFLVCAWAVAETATPAPQSVHFTPPDLRGLASGAVLNLPLREKDGYAALLQVLHQRPIATGYTARITPQRLAHVRALRRLCDRGGPEFWAQLRRLGFRNVIVAPDSIGERRSLEPLGRPPADFVVIDLR